MFIISNRPRNKSPIFKPNSNRTHAEKELASNLIDFIKCDLGKLCDVLAFLWKCEEKCFSSWNTIAKSGFSLCFPFDRRNSSCYLSASGAASRTISHSSASSSNTQIFDTNHPLNVQYCLAQGKSVKKRGRATMAAASGWGIGGRANWFLEDSKTGFCCWLHFSHFSGAMLTNWPWM